MDLRSVIFLSIAVGTVACSSGRDRDIGAPTPPERFVVGPSGGTFMTTDGVGLEVPAGALTATITMTVKKTTLPAGNEITPVSSVFEFSPAGMTFAVPITLRIPYIGGASQPLAFYYSLDTAPNVVAPVVGAQIANGVGTAMVTHFSIGCVGYPSATTSHDAGFTEGDAGEVPDSGVETRDAGTRDGGTQGGCGCEPGPKCGSCCELQSVCSYTECAAGCEG